MSLAAIRCYEKVGFLQTKKEPMFTTIGHDQWKAIEMQMEKGK